MKLVWKRIMSWLGVGFVNEVHCCSHMLKLMEMLKGKCAKSRQRVIWLSAYWCAWKLRNDIVFNNVVLNIDEMVYKVKIYSWCWLAIVSKVRIKFNIYE